MNTDDTSSESIIEDNKVRGNLGVDKYQREVRRLRNSASYRIGSVIISALVRPYRLLWLPFSLIALSGRLVAEMMGKVATPLRTLDENTKSGDVKMQNSILLFPTNGVGMGHFSRMLSLAKALRQISPKTEVIFFTTNYVLHPLYREGFTAYHLPNRKKFNKMTATAWNALCEEMIANILSVHLPHTFVFDGAFPYRGMLDAISCREEIDRIWVRRKTRSEGDRTPIDAFNSFDRIVVPGDYIENEVRELESWPIAEINLIPPLLSINRSDLLPKGSLRMRMGIPSDAVVAVVILGAGEINVIDSIRGAVVSRLLDKDAYVIVGDSMLKPQDPVFNHPNVRVVQDYPIMRNRLCFDLAVIAGGYNSVHEVVLLKLPALVIPNADTQSDDQVTRALNAAKLGGLMVVEDSDDETIGLAIDRLMDPKIRSKLVESTSQPDTVDGALALAESIIGKK